MKTTLILLIAIAAYSCAPKLHCPSYYSSEYKIKGDSIAPVDHQIHLSGDRVQIEGYSLAVKQVKQTPTRTTYVTDQYFIDHYQMRKEIYIVSIDSWEAVAVYPSLVAMD